MEFQCDFFGATAKICDIAVIWNVLLLLAGAVCVGLSQCHSLCFFSSVFGAVLCLLGLMWGCLFFVAVAIFLLKFVGTSARARPVNPGRFT